MDQVSIFLLLHRSLSPKQHRVVVSTVVSIVVSAVVHCGNVRIFLLLAQVSVTIKTHGQWSWPGEHLSATSTYFGHQNNTG